MPEIAVDLNVRDAEEPKRDALPSGDYHAVILKADPKTNKDNLSAIGLEFSVLKTDTESILTGDDELKYAGRSVWQDFVLAKGKTDFITQRNAFRLQQLLAATKCPHKFQDNGGVKFNTDHLLGKAVVISVTCSTGKPDPLNPKKEIPIFNNVDKIDVAIDPNAENMI